MFMAVVVGAEEELKIDATEWSNSSLFTSDIDSDWKIAPSTILNFINLDGKQAQINFGGDEITYTGDLPVDEAAQLLFEATFKLYKKDRTCPHCGKDMFVGAE